MQKFKRYTTTDYSGLLGSFLASWILHVILYIIAITTTVFYPPVAEREMIAIDLLFSSPGSGSLELSQKQISQSSTVTSPEKAPTDNIETEEPLPVKTPLSESRIDQNDLELVPIVQPKAEKITAIPVKASPKVVVRTKLVKMSQPPQKPVIIPASVKTPEDTPEEAVKPAAEVPPPAMEVQAKSILQSEQEKQAIENEKIRRLQEAEQKAANEKALEEARVAKIARETELEKQEAEKAARARLAAEKERIRRLQAAEQKVANERALEEARAAKIAKAAVLEKMAAERITLEREAAEKARREQMARLKSEEVKATRDRLERERAAAEKTAKERLEQARLAAKVRKNETAVPVKPVGNSLNTAISIAMTAAPEKPLPSAVREPTEKNQLKNLAELKGLAIPPVKGDIKLIMISEEDLIVKVLFVNHPKAHHDKPMTKKESRDQHKLTPVVVRTAKNTLEAVIEQSREGVYIFLVEQKGSKPANGKFSLKLFETRNKSVTGREISGQTEVARLLMPEGILWEDDNAFSGNIEDSDSLTKFNSESGLIWKEYRR